LNQNQKGTFKPPVERDQSLLSSAEQMEGERERERVLETKREKKKKKKKGIFF